MAAVTAVPQTHPFKAISSPGKTLPGTAIQPARSRALTGLNNALFLCRTPLQARICLKIMETERPGSSDVLYFTHDDNESDRLYFARLGQYARHAQYLHVPPQRYSILSDVKAYALADTIFKRSGYDATFLASIDSIFFRSLIKRQTGSALFTFDDGTSNIIQDWYISYHQDNESGRLRLYNTLAGIESRRQIKNRSSKHYTIYKDFKNICPPEKLVYLDVFATTGTHPVNPGTSFFIGQPFHEYLDQGKIARLRRFIENRQINFYVPHPRETQTVTRRIPMLKKNGELAETAIMQASPLGKPIIFAGFSTVLFNIPSDLADKYYLHFEGDDSDREMITLVEKAGCKVLPI